MAAPPFTEEGFRFFRYSYDDKSRGVIKNLKLFKEITLKLWSIHADSGVEGPLCKINKARRENDWGGGTGRRSWMTRMANRSTEHASPQVRYGLGCFDNIKESFKLKTINTDLSNSV